MHRINNVIYAEPDQSGRALRKELKAKKLPKQFFFTTKRDRSPPFKLKMAKSEDDIHLTEMAEKKGFAVLDIINTNAGKLIRTIFRK